MDYRRKLNAAYDSLCRQIVADVAAEEQGELDEEAARAALDRWCASLKRLTSLRSLCSADDERTVAVLKQIDDAVRVFQAANEARSGRTLQ
jgi:hypothetical protein